MHLTKLLKSPKVGNLHKIFKNLNFFEIVQNFSKTFNNSHNFQIHWNPSIVDFFVKAKSSTIEGFSTNEGFLCSEKSNSQA